MAAINLYVDPTFRPDRYVSQEPLPGRIKYETTVDNLDDGWEIVAYRDVGFIKRRWFIIHKVGTTISEPTFIGRDLDKLKVLARLVRAGLITN